MAYIHRLIAGKTFPPGGTRTYDKPVNSHASGGTEKPELFETYRDASRVMVHCKAFQGMSAYRERLQYFGRAIR